MEKFVRTRTSKIWTLIWTFMLLATVLVYCIFIKSDKANTILVVSILAEDLYMVVRSRRNWSKLIIYAMILYFNYSILMANYIVSNDSYFTTTFANDEVLNQAIQILYVFNSVLVLLFNSEKKRTKIEFLSENHPNSIVVFGLIAVLVLVFIFGFERPDVAGERGSPSTYYEYSVILLTVAFLYSKKGYQRILLTVILFSYVLQNMIFGGRVTALQLLICWFLIMLADRFTLKQIAFPAFAIFLVFLGIGSDRTNYTLGLASLIEAFKGGLSTGFSSDTSWSAFFTSMTFIKVGQRVGFGFRLMFFLRFLLSMFLGGSLVPNSNLSIYTRKFYVHYYGGITPYYGYFFLGGIGVILIAVWVSFLINRLCIDNTKGTKSEYGKALQVYIASTVPRWYLYSLSNLFRGVMLVILVCFIASVIRNGKDAFVYRGIDVISNRIKTH